MNKTFLLLIVLASCISLSFENKVIEEHKSFSITLDPGDNLAAAILDADSGSIICLNDGDYGNVDLIDINKNGYVTIRSINPKGASLGYTQISNCEFISIEDVIINGAIINACSRHIKIKSSKFIDVLTLRNDGGCTPTSNLDIILDGNIFNGLDEGIWEGGLSIGLTGSNSGIVITNNIFGGGGCSDGIQLIGGVGGVQIGPGNIFRDLIQGSCNAPVDAIQAYGAGSGNVIEGNYFYNNTVNIGIYDGGSDYIIRDNVFDTPNDLDYSALQLGGINTLLMEHNTFINTVLGIGTKHTNSPNINWTVQNNIFDNSFFTASGDQPGFGDNGVKQFNMKSRGGTTNPEGTNNIIDNAVYSGKGSLFNWIGWELKESSPGKKSGNDKKDLGVNYYGPHVSMSE